MSQTPHILTITQGEGDDVDYALTCPGTTAGSCLDYKVCSVDVEHDFEEMQETGEAHGVEHECINGDWMVPTDGECWVRQAAGWDWMTHVNNLALPPGEHQVLHHGSSDEDFQLYLPGTTPRF